MGAEDDRAEVNKLEIEVLKEIRELVREIKKLLEEKNRKSRGDRR